MAIQKNSPPLTQLDNGGFNKKRIVRDGCTNQEKTISKPTEGGHHGDKRTTDAYNSGRRLDKDRKGSSRLSSHPLPKTLSPPASGRGH